MAPPLLLLLLSALLRPGAAEPEAEGRPVACLAWSLDGEAEEEEEETPGGTARHLNCSASDAPLALHVQFQAGGARAEGLPAGPVLLLLLLVQARPPARVSWADRHGRRRTLNASHFLLVDAETDPRLAARSLHLQLRAGARHPSPDGAPLPPPGFLATRVELPLPGLVAAAAGALALLLALGALSGYVGYRRGKAAAAGLAPPARSPASDSDHVKRQGPRLPRANRSLPSNLQLHAFTPEPKAEVTARGEEEEEEEEGALSEPENSLALASRGLSRFPMVGYIYRASSGSSEEIWL